MICLLSGNGSVADGMIFVNAILAMINAFASPAYKAIVPEIMSNDEVLGFNANLETIHK